MRLSSLLFQKNILYIILTQALPGLFSAMLLVFSLHAESGVSKVLKVKKVTRVIKASRVSKARKVSKVLKVSKASRAQKATKETRATKAIH